MSDADEEEKDEKGKKDEGEKAKHETLQAFSVTVFRQFLQGL